MGGREEGEVELCTSIDKLTIVGHGQDRDLSDRAISAFHTTSTLKRGFK